MATVFTVDWEYNSSVDIEVTPSRLSAHSSLLTAATVPGQMLIKLAN